MDDPNYDGPVGKLLGAFRRARSVISSAVSRLFRPGANRRDADAATKGTSETIAALNAEAKAWVDDNLTRAAHDGVKRAIIDLGVAKTLLEAAEKAKLNRANRDMLAAAILDTQADVLAVTANMDRKTKAAIRQALAESLRANLAQGINTSPSISRDVLDRMRKALGDAVDSGIIDSAGRRWKAETYVEMLVRTKMAETQRQATINEALARGVLYGQISRHGAKDACSKWEGRIVKLTPDAPGDYPYIGDLPRREIFHPNCRHVVSPIRNPERLNAR